MSVVNKMLRDLDARHAAAQERAALPSAVTPLAARVHRTWSPTAVVGLLVGLGLIVALGVFAWMEFRHAGTARSPSVPPPVAATPPVAVPAAAPIVAPAAPPPMPENPPSPPAVSSARDALPAGPAAVGTLRLADQLSPLADVSAKRDKPAAAPKSPAAEKPNRKADAGRNEEHPKPAEPAARPASTSAAQNAPKAVPPSADAQIEKRERTLTPAERAEADYRRGLQAQRQGQGEQAQVAFRAALAASADHAAARQALAAQLIEARRLDDAEEILRAGTEIPSVRLASVLALARLKVERNQAATALDLLLRNSAAGDGSAEFQGFAGALLNRAGRSAEATDRYRQATRLAPKEGRWWAALGIALDATGQESEAREAYQRARLLPGLPEDLARHVEHRLR